MPRISIPGDSPPVPATSAVFPAMQPRAELDYHDDLPISEDVLTARVFAACPQLRLLSVWGNGTDR